MNRRSGWKQHAIAGGQERRPYDQYPQASAACELWARDNLREGLTRYNSPCAKEQAYGTVVARGADEYNEVSEMVSAVLLTLPEESLAVIRAHYLSIVMLKDRAYRIPRSYWPAKVARRYFNATVDWYWDWLAIGLAKVANELGLDGQ
jgi:hypothetical protein